MTVIQDLYRQLFGRSGTARGTDIDMAEHGRVGGLSTGESYKKVGIVDGLPTDAGKSNPPVVLTYNGFNQLTGITKTIDGVTYTKTLSYTGDNLTDISSWS
jgi:hypothetical protein